MLESFCYFEQRASTHFNPWGIVFGYNPLWCGLSGVTGLMYRLQVVLQTPTRFRGARTVVLGQRLARLGPQMT